MNGRRPSIPRCPDTESHQRGQLARHHTLAGRSGLRSKSTDEVLSGEQFFNFAPGELPLQPGTHLGHNAGGRM